MPIKNCLHLLSGDPMLSNTFSMKPTYKIADMNDVRKDHNYAFFTKTKIDVIVEKTQIIIDTPVDPDFMFFDIDYVQHKSPFI